MSPYLVLPLLILITLIQTTLLPIFLPGPVRPDLMLMVVVGWGVVHGDGQASLWGLVGGLLLDLFSGAPFGRKCRVTRALIIKALFTRDWFISNSTFHAYE